MCFFLLDSTAVLDNKQWLILCIKKIIKSTHFRQDITGGHKSIIADFMMYIILTVCLNFKCMGVNFRYSVIKLIESHIIMLSLLFKLF